MRARAAWRVRHEIPLNCGSRGRVQTVPAGGMIFAEMPRVGL